MIDLVTANEFTFTPSAFIAAYIEQSETTTVSETTGNGGELNTLPQQIANLNGSGTFQGILGTGGNNYSTTGFPPIYPLVGASVTYPINIGGTLSDLVGQKVTDTRSTTKTVTTSKGVTNTVVLVLSYGTFKAKCSNAQATVTAIYNQVATYLNSL